MSYIYLVQTRESIKLNESIYKIGKTKRIGLERFTSYPKGSDLLFHIACPDCDILEKHLIDEFKNKYTQITDYGTEYFKGEPDKMIDNIFSLVKKQKDACKKVNIKIETEQNSVIEEPEDEPSNNLITENKGKIKIRKLQSNDHIVSKIYSCKICNKRYQTQNGLWKHNQKCYPLLISQYTDQKYVYKCKNCNKLYDNRNSKYKHQKKCITKFEIINNKTEEKISVIKNHFNNELNKLMQEVETIKSKPLKHIKQVDIDV